MNFDRPRRANEDVISWAISTQRIAAAGEANWRGMLAKGTVTPTFVESLATPLPPDPVPPAVRQQQAKATIATVRAKLGLAPTASKAEVLAAIDKLPKRPAASTVPDLSAGEWDEPVPTPRVPANTSPLSLMYLAPDEITAGQEQI